VSYAEKEQQLLQKFEALAIKSKLSKKPKLRIEKQFAPASYKDSNNTIYVDKRTIEEWAQGRVGEREVDYILAHEFGHAIAHTKHKDRIASLTTVYITGLLLALLFFFGVHLSFNDSMGSLTSGITIIVIIVIWLLFLPWILRKIHVPWELLANRCAIDYFLISADDMAAVIINCSPILENIGPIKLLKILYSLTTHPFLAENLLNIGFRYRNGNLEKIDKTD
jgi:hypothetical protein